MAEATRTFRVFVSSTFEDLVAERDVLQRGLEVDGAWQEGAFTRLRRLCESRGARFQAVDLRWGVSEEAALDQRTIPLCLAEVERCRRLSPRPSFLAILGDRYGWRPLPDHLSDAHWKLATTELDENDLDLVRHWYRRDDNAVPAVSVLLPRDEQTRDPAAWQQVEQRLRALLEPTLGAGLSATEQEMRAGVLLDEAPGSSAFVFLRTIEGLPSDAAAAPYVDISAGGRDQGAATAVSTLRTRLRDQLGNRVREYRAAWSDGALSTEHLGPFNQDVYDALAGAVTTELDRLEELDPLDVERAAHVRFAADRSAHLVGREEVLDQVDRRRTEVANLAVALWGAPGSGKSAVLAELAHRAGVEHPEAVVICRFVGATPTSGSGPELLRSIWAEIDRAYAPTDRAPQAAPGDENQLVSRFVEQLRRATEEKPLILLLDGIDQLPAHDPVRRLTWLPDYLPMHVAVTLSTRPGTELDHLRGQLGDDQVIEVPGLSAADGSGLLAHWLASTGRTLQPEQERVLLTAFEASSGLPLHLRLACEEARLWRSWEQHESLPTDVAGLIEVLFARLGREENHGSVLLGRSLGLLAASRNGLTEDELLDLLSGDAAVMADFVRRSPRSPSVERLPVVVWSRLYADLEPYLSARAADGTVTIGFYHRELADAAARAYLSDEDGPARHAQLADYFGAHRGADPIPLRVRSELPFQLARAGRLEAATDLLTDHEFVRAKIAASGVSALLEDLDETVRRGGTDPALGLLREALLLSVDTLTDDPDQLSAHLIGRLGRVADPRIERLVAGARDRRGPAWLRPLSASLTAPGEPLIRILRGRFDPVSAVAFSPDGTLAAGGSFGRDVRVWELATGFEVLHFIGSQPGGAAEGQGGDRIIDLRFTEGGLLAASADRCVYVIDLRAGVGRMASHGETDNLYAMAILGENAVASAPQSIWGYGGTTIQVWDLHDGPATDIPGLTGTCFHLAASSDGRAVVSCGDEDLVTRWDLGGDGATGARRFAGASVAALSSDAALWAVGTADGTIEVGDPNGPPGVGLTLTGHRGRVSALTFARADLLVSAGQDRTVRCWDLGIGRELRCLRGHAAGVTSVTATTDGRRILSGGADGNIHLWDLGREPIAVTGRPAATHAGPVRGAAIGADCAATWAADEPVLRWELTNGDSSSVPGPAASDLAAAELDHLTGRTPIVPELLAAAQELDEGAPRSDADARHVVTGVAVSADGRRAMTSSNDNVMVFYRLNVTRDESRVRLWDLDTGSRLRVLAFREESGVSYSSAEAFRCVAIDATGRFGAAGGDDRTLRVWDLDNGEQVAAFTGDAAITACAISDDAGLLVVGEATGRVHLLRFERPAPGSEPARTTSDRVALDPQAGERWGGGLRHFWGRLATDQDWVEAIAVSPDGEQALVAGADGSVLRFNLVDRRAQRLERDHGDWTTAVAYSTDGRLAASGSADGEVFLFEPGTGRSRANLAATEVAPVNGVWSLAGLRDGRSWLIGDGAGGVLVWDPAAAAPTRLEVHPGAVTALAQLGGDAVASAAVDGTLAVTNPISGTISWRSDPGPPVWAMTLVDGDVCVGRGTALETWDVVTGQLRWSLETGHRTPICAVAVTPDGRRVLTGSVDGEVRMTDTGAGVPLGLLQRTGWPISTIAVTPDGASALVGGHGAEVVGVSLAEPCELLEESVRARYTDAEWTLVRRLPGIVWSFVAAADGNVDAEEVAQMSREALARPPVPEPVDEFADLLLADADTALSDPEQARFDGDFGLARAVLRRRLNEAEYRQVVAVLIASARRVAAASHRLLEPKVNKAEEAALRTMEERF